jgi:CheY-like chemotaxis protein
VAAQKTILVVDDDRDLVDSVSTYLTARGYDIVRAYNSGEAKEEMARNRPDLIVLDIMMDYDAEGFTFAFVLKSDEATRQIPIVILSGFADYLDTKADTFAPIMAQDWPAAAYLQKPVSLRDLAETVERLIAAPNAAEV